MRQDHPVLAFTPIGQTKIREQRENSVGRSGKGFVDLGQSGTDDTREQFGQLLDAIETGTYDYVVCWEISRLSRRGATLQEFFDTCEDTETTVVITDGAVEKVTPDGQDRFVVDVIGMVYQQERRQMIRRIEAGQHRAQREGKWLGQVPAGFKRDGEGYLQPLLDANHDEGKVGYLELREALRRVDEGESYRSVAASLPISRQGLSNIHQDDDRVNAALESVRSPPTDDSLTHAESHGR